MNTELQAMIDAGRKAIEAQVAAVTEGEDAILRGIHLAKLPAWMHEYVTVTHWDHSVRIYLDLPGCAPIYVDSISWDNGFARLGVADPLAVLFDDEGEEWCVSSTARSCQELETAVALAADYGEAYWQMRAEAARRDAEGLRPKPKPTEAEPKPNEVAAGEKAPSMWSAFERIAVALERIADRLDGFSDNSEACDALRVNVLR